MLLGYNTWSMPMLSTDETIGLCGRLGFDSIELTVCEGWPTDAQRTDAAERVRIRSLIADAGLVLSGCTANVPVIGLDWDDNRTALVAAFDFAADIAQGSEVYVTTTTGHEDGVHPSQSWQPHRHKLAERFGELAELARQRGVTMHLEPNVATACRRPEQALWMLAQVSSPNLRLTLDISHFEVQGDDRETVVRTLGPHAGAVEVKDERGIDPDFDFLIPGEGDMDYPALLRELTAIGFDRSVSVEISVYRQRVRGYDPVDAATRSYAVLAAAFGDAGLARAA